MYVCMYVYLFYRQNAVVLFPPKNGCATFMKMAIFALQLKDSCSSQLKREVTRRIF